MARSLTPVNIIAREPNPNAYYAVVVKDGVTGVVSEREITAAEYQSKLPITRLAKPLETVLYAYGNHRFSTLSGKLDPGTYAGESAERVLVKIDASTPPVGIASSFVRNDVLSDAGEAEVTKLAARQIA